MDNYTKLKDKGNQLFKQKKFAESIQTFQSAIDLIHQQQPKNALTNQTQVGKLYVILNINAAFAGLNIKTKQSYRQAEQYCNIALQIDPKNQKGMYRRALANKEYAQLLQLESKGTSEELLVRYNIAKKDLEDLTILDRTNQVAKQKLTEVIKNIYRVTVTQGKQVNFSAASTKVQESGNSPFKKTEEKPISEQPKPVKKSADMNKILKEYRVEEVTSIVRQKVQHQYLTQDLPKTRAEVEKAIRQIQKSQQVFLQFIYRMNNEYLKKIQPTFDMLFQLVNTVIKIGGGEEARNALVNFKNQKSFDLLWKSYTASEKKIFKQKWESLGLNSEEVK